MYQEKYRILYSGEHSCIIWNLHWILLNVSKYWISLNYQWISLNFPIIIDMLNIDRCYSNTNLLLLVCIWLVLVPLHFGWLTRLCREIVLQYNVPPCVSCSWERIPCSSVIHADVITHYYKYVVITCILWLDNSIHYDNHPLDV